ncbi:glucuronate isomerase [bacterium]|nr:glucuronate isomerase [bacterium]
MTKPLHLHEDRYFSPDPVQRECARKLYQKVSHLPLICPHGHVDPRLLAENTPFPNPTELLVLPDHYLFRMLHSQGISLETLGIRTIDGSDTETDPRKIWQIVGDHFYLFRGTPTGLWLKQELKEVLGVSVRLDGNTALDIYDQISDCLKKPENLPRAMFERFNIEVLSTADSPTDLLEAHEEINKSGWKARIIPSFRPDNVTNIHFPEWIKQLRKLEEITGFDCSSYSGFIKALEDRRTYFKKFGCVATDHGVTTAYTGSLSLNTAGSIYSKALKGEATQEEAVQFTGHMLMEMARMSIEDGMTMQVHMGVLRNHDPRTYQRFGADKGADIPIRVDFVNGLKPLLNTFGNDPRLTIICFSMDESTYAREAAPLAGYYPALKLGPAWWFHDSREGMMRFRRWTTETAGFYNTVGFNDDTRAFPSIPSRHDLARRVDSRFLAELVSEHVLDMDEAEEIIVDLAYNLVKKNYHL